MSEFAKDPSSIYRKAYYDKLQNLNVANRNVPVYDVVPTDAVAPFIILSSTQLSPFNTNLSFGFDAEITLDIVTRFQQGGGKKLSDDIGNAIFSKAYTKANFFKDSQWNITATQLERSRYIESESTGGYVIRKLITFSNFIEQL